MNTDWEEIDRLDAFGTFGGHIIPYNGVWKIMLNETNCELWSLKTRPEAEAKLADAIKKSGYSDDENPLIEARLWRDLVLLDPMDLMVIYGGAENDAVLLGKLKEFIEAKRREPQGGGS